MTLNEVIEAIAPYAALPSLLAFLLLLPLYLSQRRDIVRLRTWMEREPDHPGADIRASEAQLDRAESELERLVGSRGEGAQDTVVQSPAARVAATTAAARVTGERPALARITIERAALEPHPRWRRFARRATQPWVLAVIAVIAVLAGTAAIIGSERLLSGGDGEREAPAETFDPSEISVTVMNGTELSGLGSRVESDVSANEYEVIAVTSAPVPAARTEVMFVRGQRDAALRVARDLGVRENRVGRMDPDIRQLSGGADVVVIAGEDRG